MTGRRWVPLAALVAVAALPWAADRLRTLSKERCALDGVAVDEAFRVRVVGSDDRSRSLCGVRCARLWLERADAAPRSIRVTDLVSGSELEADDAWFVRSVSTWGEGAPDSIRVFARKADAVRHVEAYGGRILEDPFGDGTHERAEG